MMAKKVSVSRSRDAAVKPAESNLRIAERLELKEKEQSALFCLAAKIAAARTRQDLWDIINSDILHLFGACFYTICLLEKSGDTHSPFIHSRDNILSKSRMTNPIMYQSFPVADGIFDRALLSVSPLILTMREITSQKKAPPYILNWKKLGIQELMVVRIINGMESRGVLYLYADKQGSFATGSFNMLAGIADLLGTGICNVLANEQIEAQLEEISQYKEQLEEEYFYLQQDKQLNNHFSGLVGTSKEIQKVYDLIAQVAPTDSTVLLSGETGTGKELMARAIHEASPRKNKIMIKVNCAAIPANLIESELFGHEKGSFTGATDRRIGKFELANNSTLFLDEIGELPLELQSKLLRVLQEREIERVGGRSTIKVNVRIIAATNKILEKEVAQHHFRRDLYYRLNVFPISLPPLRKRKEDIPALTAFFIERFARSTGKKISGISNKALEKLLAYSWPGNIRELEHLIERSVLLTKTAKIRDIQLPVRSDLLPHSANGELHIRPLAEIEREYILKALKISGGRVSGPRGAAIKLALPATTLISKMQKLGIRKDHFAEGSTRQ